MQGILRFLRGFMFWFSVILFTSGLFLGAKFMSFTSYNLYKKSPELLTDPNYASSFKSNVFFRLDKWAEPEKYKDLLQAEKKRRLKEFRENEAEIEKANEAK